MTVATAGRTGRDSIRMAGVADAIAGAGVEAAAASTSRPRHRHRLRRPGRRKGGSMLRATADTFGDPRTATSPKAVMHSSRLISFGRSDCDAATPSRLPWDATAGAV